jgi:signal transduction histidine kinase
MDGIRGEIDGIFAEEKQLLSVRRSHANALREVVLGLIDLCLISSMGLAVLILRAITHYVQRLDAEAQLRRETEDMLRQSQKIEAVGQLTGGIAHDFNNMLAIISSGVNLAQRRLVKGEAGAEALLSSVSEGAHRAAALVRRLLAFSRQQPLEPKPIDANKFVAGLSELISRSLGEAIKVETILGGGLWLMHTDPAQLENSILNLCVNARDAMPEGGRLTVETANCHLDDRYSRLHPGCRPGSMCWSPLPTRAPE